MVVLQKWLSNDTAEEQITGEAEHGGIQIIVFPMKREMYEEMLRANFFWESTAGATLCLDPEENLALLTANVTVCGRVACED